ncbi:MAG TPA: hypothetical protein VFJ19_02500 [Nocardioidaceae bacterium]|nr:hypothetical protein [Nocardioidaceae bacterium]
MSTGVSSPTRARIEQKTLRRDPWWRTPAMYAATLSVIGIYLAFAVFVNRNYYWEPYLSPLYAPCLPHNCIVGSGYNLFPSIAPVTPALIVIIFPAGLRATCYYYRKAYYRSFFLSPAACAVPEPRKGYTGESRFPLIVQNVHRWFFYITLIFNALLTYDAVMAFRDHQGNWGHAGLGTLMLVINAILLWGYNASCHSCRHAIGGRLRHFSKHPIRYWLWSQATTLNAKHAQIAWVSFVFVALTDVYIRLVAGGAISDVRFF